MSTIMLRLWFPFHVLLRERLQTSLTSSVNGVITLERNTADEVNFAVEKHHCTVVIYSIEGTKQEIVQEKRPQIKSLS